MRTAAIWTQALLYLMHTVHLSVDALNDLLNRQSGLLGMSGLSSDMKKF
ncbi:MAG: hypothetical protein P8Y75_05465 [Nitrospirota bacterium]